MKSETDVAPVALSGRALLTDLYQLTMHNPPLKAVWNQIFYSMLNYPSQWTLAPLPAPVQARPMQRARRGMKGEGACGFCATSGFTGKMPAKARDGFTPSLSGRSFKVPLDIVCDLHYVCLVQMVKFHKTPPKTDEARVLGRQALRSGTSVAANYRAICRFKSQAFRS